MVTKAKKTVKKEVKFDYKKIKSFENACKQLNIDAKKLPDVSMVPEEFQKAIINYYKLCIIYKAINNGWTPDWSNYNQLKYYPWYEVLSSGFGFSAAYDHCTDANSAVGSRLCTYSSEVALYIAKQFGEEYKEFLLISK